MDDVTLGGQEAEVARDVTAIQTAGKAIGLELNVKKCEFISSDALSTEPVFRDFVHVDVAGATLLGAPLTAGTAMDSALESRCSELARAAGRLKLIAAHDALILLRASFSAPKLMHTLRSAPCAGHPALEKFDNLQRDCVSSITNTDLSDLQWVQASLPVKNGGLGIRRVASLAPSAFLASAASTRELQEQIVGRHHSLADTSADKVLVFWTSRYNTPPPIDQAASQQRAWDKASIDNDVQMLTSNLQDARDKARLLAVSAPHSGDWLHALPITACGLRLDDEAVRVAVGLRLGCVLCEPHICPCGAHVDSRGTHGLACKRSAGRTVRHHQINDVIWRALCHANIPSIKEPTGLLRSDGKRPDGLTQIPWHGGKCLTWDVTVTDTLAASYVDLTAANAGAAAEGAASRKEEKYRALQDSHIFMPIAMETFGPLNRKATVFLSELGKLLTAVSDDAREGAFLFQRLSVLIQRFNAISFHGSFSQSTESES
jgi:hypothetical protein